MIEGVERKGVLHGMYCCSCFAFSLGHRYLIFKYSAFLSQIIEWVVVRGITLLGRR